MSEYTRCPHPKVRGEAQSTNALCWLACYITLFRWGGMEDKKIEPYVIDRLAEAGINIPDARHSGLKRKDNLTAAKALGLGATGYGQPVTVHNLRGLIRQSPLWASGQWFKGSNHVYVLVGVSDDWVEYYDPWYDSHPSEAMEMRKVSTEWILQGNGKDMKGLAHTFQSYPLHYFKR